MFLALFSFLSLQVSLEGLLVEKNQNKSIAAEELGSGYDFSTQESFSTTRKKTSIFDETWLATNLAVKSSNIRESRLEVSESLSGLVKQNDSYWANRIGVHNAKLSGTNLLKEHHVQAKAYARSLHSSALNLYHRAIDGQVMTATGLYEVDDDLLNHLDLEFLANIVKINDLQKQIEANHNKVIQDELKLRLNERLMSLTEKYGTHVITSMQSGLIMESFKGIYFEMQQITAAEIKSLKTQFSSTYSMFSQTGNYYQINIQMMELQKAYVFRNIEHNRIYTDASIYVNRANTMDSAQVGNIYGAYNNGSLNHEKMIDDTIPIATYIEKSYQYAAKALKSFLPYYNNQSYIDYPVSPGNGSHVNLPVVGKVNEINYYQTLLITDAGISNNGFVFVDLSSIFTNLDSLKRAGFNNMNIRLTFRVEDVHRGYRQIYFFSTQNEYDSKRAWISKEFSDQSNPSKRIIDEKVSIYHLVSNHFYLRFDASGSFADDWKISGIKLEITFSK